MSQNLKCPECGAALEPGAKFCGDCGATIPQQPAKPSQPAQPAAPAVNAPQKPAATPSKTTASDDGRVPTIGDKANIMGNVNTTSNTTRNTTNNLQTNTTTNTSNVDNSSNVQNNTTIVMNGEKAEYCQICGNPFGESHPRCPKCGKQVCFDCMVKGKNRCIECEKKAMDDYRFAFQQLLLSTAGDLGKAGRQMMDQKARELNVADSKAKIEAEFADYAKPQKAPQSTTQSAQKPQQPQPQQQPRPQSQQHKSMPSGNSGEKRIAVPDSLVSGGSGTFTPSGMKSSKSPAKLIIAVVVVLAIAAAAYFILGNKSDKAPATEDAPKTEVQKPATQTKPAEATKPAETKKPAEATKPAESKKPAEAQKPAQTKPAASKTDKNYEAGMIAYKAGKGQDAIKSFNASGSAESNYMLGMIYKNGCGTIGKNEMMARKFFKKAASMGHEGAKAEL